MVVTYLSKFKWEKTCRLVMCMIQFCSVASFIKPMCTTKGLNFLMCSYVMGVGEAEEFSERLKRELQALEAANVHAILESEPLINEVFLFFELMIFVWLVLPSILLFVLVNMPLGWQLIFYCAF